MTPQQRITLSLRAAATAAATGIVTLWLAGSAGAAPGAPSQSQVKTKSAAAAGLSTTELAAVWDAEHVSPPLPPLITHQDVVDRVTQIVKETPDLFSQEVIGQSLEGRSIHHVWFGTGKMPILLWSQMHGDEPTATAALFDLTPTSARIASRPR
jgi:hypothetical protein